MELELKANLFTLDGETNGILEKSFPLSELDKKGRGKKRSMRMVLTPQGQLFVHRAFSRSLVIYPICFLKAGLEKEKDDFNRNHVHMGSDH